jgi:hypothetical protein
LAANIGAHGWKAASPTSQINQRSVARSLADRDDADPRLISAPFPELLGRLYVDDFVFAQVVCAIDLDARRFEVRRVRNTDAIRCVYDPSQNEIVRFILGAQISVTGNYETLETATPAQFSESNRVHTPG